MFSSHACCISRFRKDISRKTQPLIWSLEIPVVKTMSTYEYLTEYSNTPPISRTQSSPCSLNIQHNTCQSISFSFWRIGLRCESDIRLTAAIPNEWWRTNSVRSVRWMTHRAHAGRFIIQGFPGDPQLHGSFSHNARHTRTAIGSRRPISGKPEPQSLAADLDHSWPRHTRKHIGIVLHPDHL
jgi:hypothetical protein